VGSGAPATTSGTDATTGDPMCAMRLGSAVRCPSTDDAVAAAAAAATDDAVAAAAAAATDDTARVDVDVDVGVEKLNEPEGGGAGVAAAERVPITGVDRKEYR
jgi:hypothetical protein